MNQDWENEILKLLSESGKALDSFEIAEKRTSICARFSPF